VSLAVVVDSLIRIATLVVFLIFNDHLNIKDDIVVTTINVFGVCVDWVEGSFGPPIVSIDPRGKQ
jgi:hypothetical protein